MKKSFIYPMLAILIFAIACKKEKEEKPNVEKEETELVKQNDTVVPKSSETDTVQTNPADTTTVNPNPADTTAVAPKPSGADTVATKPLDTVSVANLSYKASKYDTSQSFVNEYIEFNTTNKYLKVKHKNIQFCNKPENIFVKSFISNDTMFIYEETSKYSGCSTFMYDLNYTLQFSYGKYHVILKKNNKIIHEFELDYNSQTNANLIIKDDIFVGKTEKLNVKKFSHTDCKSHAKSAYKYKSAKKEYLELSSDGKYLKIKHINAKFNCCPGKIFITSKISKNIIFIDEDETLHDCNCVCDYDLDYKVGPLKYKKYLIVMTQMKDPVPYKKIDLNFNSNTKKIVNIENKYN